MTRVARALWRHRPEVLLVLVTVAAVTSAAGWRALPLFVIAQFGLVIHVASRRERRQWVGLVALVALVDYGTSWYYADNEWLSPRNLGLIAWVSLAAAAGDAIRNRRAYVAAVEERARRAEETREQEAQRRVLAERMRIARELHDVVAHHIAVISVQAGVASHAVERSPAQVLPALSHIRDSADVVLQELATVVGLLRQGDGTAGTEPAPGLDRLPELLEDVARSGQRVSAEVDSLDVPLPALSDLAAYRIVQESLINVRKHGRGEASLLVRAEDGVLRIEVRNRAGERPTDAPASGFGLTGMRERAAAAGGRLDAGPTTDGWFVVTALLPLA